MFGLFRMPRFIRRFIRRRTAKMEAGRALEVKERLSLAYAFVAWNLFGVLAYFVYTGRFKKVEPEEEEKLSGGRYYVKLLHLRNANLTSIKGLSSIEHYDLREEEGFETDEVKKEGFATDELKKDEEFQ